jgi:bile acid-coenzyme A ligase
MTSDSVCAMTPDSGEKSYGAQLCRWALTRPQATAIIFVDEMGCEAAIAYDSLARRAGEVAHPLPAAGVGVGEFVPIALANSVEFFIALFGVWMTGACPAPVRHDSAETERAQFLDLIKPKLFIGNWPVDVPHISLADITATATASLELPQVSRLVPPRMWAIGSGGSTGKPKLIINLRPASTTGRYAVMLDAAETVTQATHLICGPLYHTHALLLSLGGLMMGDRIVVLSRFDAVRAARMIQRHKVAMVGFVATMLNRMLRVPDLDTYDFSSLRLVLAGAGAIPSSILDRWIGLVGADHFMIGYGSSEGVGATRMTGADLKRKPGSVGQAFECDIQILDDEMRPCTTGTVGNIHLRSRFGKTFQYMGAPEPQEAPGGFIFIGDLGWLDEEGYLYIAERRTDMIKTGGVNVFPAEVESRLIEHPAVADVAVVGLPDSEWGRRLHAIVVPTDPDRPPSVEDLTRYCKSCLSAPKVPKSFEFIDRLPRNDAMKLNRGSLMEERIATTKVGSA